MTVSLAERAHGVADSLMSKYFFRTMKDTREVYVFNRSRGVYTNSADRLVESTTEEVLHNHSTGYVVNEVVNIIRRRTYTEREDFDSSEYSLVVGNGILNTDTRELCPHSPDHLALRSVAVDYDSYADCPTIRKFLSDVLAEHDREIVEMFLGYLLIPDHRYKKSLVMVGPRDTGKTTLLSLFFGLLGADNISGESLQDLCDNRFSSSALVGKIANVRDDLTAVSLKNAEKLKELTGNFDRTRGEHKGMPSFQFKNRAKLVFTCNILPPAGNADEVYYQRWCVVEMRKRFVLGDRTVHGRVADPKLAGRMRSELSGLLNLALDGRDRLLAQNGFKDVSDDDAKIKYLAYAGDSAGRFLVDAVYVDLRNVVKRADIYGEYQVYCNLRNTAYKSEEEFTRTFKAVFPQAVECWVDRVRAWRGVAVKPRAEVEHKLALHRTVNLRPSSFVDYDEEDDNG